MICASIRHGGQSRTKASVSHPWYSTRAKPNVQTVSITNQACGKTMGTAHFREVTET